MKKNQKVERHKLLKILTEFIHITNMYQIIEI